MVKPNWKAPIKYQILDRRDPSSKLHLDTAALQHRVTIGWLPSAPKLIALIFCGLHQNIIFQLEYTKRCMSINLYMAGTGTEPLSKDLKVSGSSLIPLCDLEAV